MIIKMGWNYGWNSIKELVDTAVSPELLTRIEKTIHTVDGVKKIHQLRSRFMGNDILIDVHILVSPKISVSEGHYIAQHVHHVLTDQIDNIKDVIVHVDPEDDEVCSPSLHLPSRDILEKQLFKDLRQNFPQILEWNIHYLDGKVGIDVYCDKQLTQWKELHQQIISGLQKVSKIESVRLFSSHEK